MVIVRFATGESWDVVDEDCEFRPCFRPGFDKGSFTQGVGYTGYYKNPFPVCMTRHLSGCPHKDPKDGVAEVYDDGTVLLALLDPAPCCANQSVANPKKGTRPYRQRCRGCGRWLRGKALDRVREDS